MFLKLFFVFLRFAVEGMKHEYHTNNQKKHLELMKIVDHTMIEFNVQFYLTYTFDHDDPVTYISNEET